MEQVVFAMFTFCFFCLMDVLKREGLQDSPSEAGKIDQV